jgi:cytoskeletal protein RodZ
MRGGWKNTYHFKVIWEKLYQLIAGIQQALPAGRQAQNVPTEKVERTQTVSTEPEQNVSTRWKQNAATHNRDNNTENKETEKTDRENQETWEKTVEQLKSDLPVGETTARLAGTTLIEVTDTSALIFVPNRFTIPWLERRLYGQIQKAMKRVLERDVDLQFVTSPS